MCTLSYTLVSLRVPLNARAMPRSARFARLVRRVRACDALTCDSHAFAFLRFSLIFFEFVWARYASVQNLGGEDDSEHSMQEILNL